MMDVMSEYTQMKGAGKSRHLPIGTPGSCLTEDDRDVVFDSVDMSGPECRRCRIPVPPARVINIQFTITSMAPASVLELARTRPRQRSLASTTTRLWWSRSAPASRSKTRRVETVATGCSS